MSYARKAVKGTAIVFILSILGAFLGYLVRLILAKNLPQSEYGLFYAVVSFYGLLAIFKELGMNQAIVKFIAKFNVEGKRGKMKSTLLYIFKTQLIFTILVLIPVFIFRNELALMFFKDKAAALLLSLYGLYFLLLPVENMFRYSFQGFQRMGLYGSVEFFKMVLILSSILIWFKFLPGLQAVGVGYVIGFAILMIIHGIIFFTIIFPDFFKLKREDGNGLFKEIINFSIPAMIGIVAGIVMGYTDTLTITWLKTLEDVALYQAALPTSKILMYFPYSLSIVMLPLASELFAKKKYDSLETGITRLYKFSIIIAMPICLSIFVFPSLVLKLLFGTAYMGGFQVLQILALGAIIFVIANTNSNILLGIGKAKENAKIVTVAAIINLILNIILISLLGISGAAIATAISFFFMAVFTTREIMKTLKVKLPLKAWAKTFLGGSLFAYILYYIKWNFFVGNILTLLIGLVIACTIYCTYLLTSRTTNIKEILDTAKMLLSKG